MADPSDPGRPRVTAPEMLDEVATARPITVSWQDAPPAGLDGQEPWTLRARLVPDTPVWVHEGRRRPERPCPDAPFLDIPVFLEVSAGQTLRDESATFVGAPAVDPTTWWIGGRVGSMGTTWSESFERAQVGGDLDAVVQRVVLVTERRDARGGGPVEGTLWLEVEVRHVSGARTHRSTDTWWFADAPPSP